jgi:hypothetical protein
LKRTIINWFNPLQKSNCKATNRKATWEKTQYPLLAGKETRGIFTAERRRTGESCPPWRDEPKKHSQFEWAGAAYGPACLKAKIPKPKEPVMLWTICVVLLILWLLGLVTGYTLGGLIHILLVIAVIVVLVRLLSGKKPL